MNVSDNGDITAARAQFRDDILQIGGIFDRWGGDPDDLAADFNELQRLLHALLGIHGVARQHGLHHDRMVAANDDPTTRWIAHNHFA